MSEKLFKIYNDSNNFWQWDNRQKLLVLNNKITEVRFTHPDFKISKRSIVYSKDGKSICDIPDVILQDASNIIVYGCITNVDNTNNNTEVSEDNSDELDNSDTVNIICTTIGMQKFAVMKQAKPASYYSTDDDEIDVMSQLSTLSAQIRDVDSKVSILDTVHVSIDDAESWAEEHNAKNVIVLVKYGDSIVAHIIDKDGKVVPICNADNEKITINFDGGSAFGVYSESEGGE